ncbi:MAG: hypothetical protein WBO45_25625, partial [Planctomycetota bacterium]
LDRLVSDLVGDGWRVLRHDVAAGASVPAVKASIAADVAAFPGQVTTVFVLGHVPVPYSGNLNPDGHPDHQGAWPADVFYGELNGAWTDVTINNTVASRPANWNVPGDGKYDQTAIPSDIDLAVGRVDLANLPAFGLPEATLLANYLDKDHDYRHKVFAVDQRAVVDDNFGYFSGEAFAASGWRNFSVLVGSANVVAADYFTTLNTGSGNGWAWSYGCGGGSYTSAGGIGNTTNFVTSTNRGVFTMLFGSYFGDWDSTDNFLRAPLASGWTLTNAWAGRPHWSFHLMGIGDPIGACARHSQNDTSAGGYGQRWVHVALMGDPTLRQHVIAPPANVAAADLWPAANVTWTASSDPVAGYHVYRSVSSSGPFTRLTAAPVAGTAFTDPAALGGTSTYMVRATRLESTTSGSYWNLSQGAFATTSLPTTAAAHATWGSGCYTISDSFYAPFATPAAASAALTGTALTLTPANGSYVVSAGGTFVAPGGAATVLTLGDDDQVAVPLPAPFPHPGGSTSTLHVHSNGIVGLAALAMAPAASASPAAGGLLNEASSAFYAWHDFDPTEAGSGAVKTEAAGGVFYVTWDGVESEPPATANPGTLQFQFDLVTGVVRIVWQSVDALGSGGHVVGWSPGGASLDAGAIDLALGLPSAVPAVNRMPLALAAAPAPVSTLAAGTSVTYTVSEIPESSPGSGSYLGVTIVSLTQSLAGTALAPFGMPQCLLFTGALDATYAFAGGSPVQTTTFALPAGVTPGTRFYATAAALFVPGSLPNGQNAFGAVTANGVASFVNAF